MGNASWQQCTVWYDGSECIPYKIDVIVANPEDE